MAMPEIALVSDGGHIMGSKKRRDLAESDIYHSVFVLLVTRDRKVVLSDLGGGRFSATAMAICQKDETADAAAKRALQKSGATIALHHLGDHLYTAPGGRRIYMSVFYGITHGQPTDGCLLLDAAALHSRIAKAGTPALQTLWQQYATMLPV
jgi:hypothetical protein